MRGVFSVLVAVFIGLCLLYLPICVVSGSGDLVVIYVFGDSRCGHCTAMHEWLVEVYGDDKVVFCNMYEDTSCVDRYWWLVGLAVGLEPNDYGIPTIVFVNGTVRSVLIGKCRNKTEVDMLLRVPVSDRIPVFLAVLNTYTGRSQCVLKGYIDGSEEVREFILVDVLGLEEGYQGGGSSGTRSGGGGVSPGVLLAYTVSLAVLDSVNPCVFVLLSVLLVSVSVIGGKRLVASTATVFVFTVFVSYTLLGLGLYRALFFVPRWLMPLLAVVFGVLMATDYLGRIVVKKLLGRLPSSDKVCLACKVYEEAIAPKLSKSAVPPLWAGALGMMSSFTLLPCSAGPYILFAKAISALPLHEAILYLVLYNAIFIAPLLGISLLVVCASRTPRIMNIINKHEKKIRILASISIIALGLYMFLE